MPVSFISKREESRAFLKEIFVSKFCYETLASKPWKVCIYFVMFYYNSYFVRCISLENIFSSLFFFANCKFHFNHMDSVIILWSFTFAAFVRHTSRKVQVE